MFADLSTALNQLSHCRYHDLTKWTETDLRKYLNGPLWVPKRTGTDFSEDQNRLDRNNLNKNMYVLVGMYVGLYVGHLPQLTNPSIYLPMHVAMTKCKVM